MTCRYSIGAKKCSKIPGTCDAGLRRGSHFQGSVTWPASILQSNSFEARLNHDDARWKKNCKFCFRKSSNNQPIPKLCLTMATSLCLVSLQSLSSYTFITSPLNNNDRHDNDPHIHTNQQVCSSLLFVCNWIVIHGLVYRLTRVGL